MNAITIINRRAVQAQPTPVVAAAMFVPAFINDKRHNDPSSALSGVNQRQ